MPTLYKNHSGREIISFKYPEEIEPEPPLCYEFLFWAPVNKSQMKRIQGKYCLFSNDRELLMKATIEEMIRLEKEIPKAKVSLIPLGKPSYVSILYSHDGRRKNEFLEKYNNEIQYKGWKSNKDTLEGKYSKWWLRTLDEKPVKYCSTRLKKENRVSVRPPI